jgi:hypothetical protein
MRLSQWRASAPSREAAAAKVWATVDPVLSALGAGVDPDGWIAWGEAGDPRFTVLVPTPAGLITSFVRINVPGEGPRASAKLVRWDRVQLGELAVETQAGHRLLSFQVEGQVLRGADAEADRVAAFALQLFAAIDGRPMPDSPVARGRPAAAAPKKAAAAAGRPAARTKE